MPRKTITSLEAEIERLNNQIATKDEQIDFLAKDRERLHNEAAQRSATPPNTYLSYLATGDAELDALQVVYRTIAALPTSEGRERIRVYLADRFSQIRED